MDLKKAAAALERNRYAVRLFGTAAEAADYLEETIRGTTVGFGDSETLDALELDKRGVRRLLRDPGSYAVLDVGGDYIGARSIGGYAPLLNREETAACYVINPFRPWSATLEHIDRVLGETLGVSHVELEPMKLLTRLSAIGASFSEQLHHNGSEHTALLPLPSSQRISGWPPSSDVSISRSVYSCPLISAF